MRSERAVRCAVRAGRRHTRRRGSDYFAPALVVRSLISHNGTRVPSLQRPKSLRTTYPVDLVRAPGRDYHSTMSSEGMIAEAYHSTARVAGLTHGLYRYPARFSPELVRAAIDTYTEPGDWIADPFVGGGTTAVEALALARRVVAFDVNPLSVLLTGAKTTPLSRKEIWALRSMGTPRTCRPSGYGR